MDYDELEDFLNGVLNRSSLVLHNCVTRLQIEESEKSFKIYLQLMTTDPENFRAAKNLFEMKGMPISEKILEANDIDIAYLQVPVNLAIALIEQ